jgi:ribosomal protein L29
MELRQKDIKSLLVQIDQAKLKLAKMNQDLAIDKLKKTSQIGEQRKEIARIHTIIYEKMIADIDDQDKAEKTKSENNVKAEGKE